MMKKKTIWSVFIIFIFFHKTMTYAVPVMETSSITFQGTASGGILTLVEPMNRNARCISIETKAGESAESVAKRLASAINESDPFMWRANGVTGGDLVHADGSALKGLPGQPLSGSYILAGTESELGIPKPPLSLSCSYNSQKNQFTVYWMNPEGYDYIAILINGVGTRFPGTLTSYTFNKGGRNIDDLDICVVGYQGDVPSNAAAIHLNGNAQEELFGLPFTNGVSPNWQTWTQKSALALESGDGQITSQINESLIAAKGRKYNSIKTADNKPFKQVLKTSAENSSIGIWRRFLGLTPGHTYRLSARLSTLKSDANDSDWSYSLHAVADHKGADKLTENQMTGLTALPDGKKGPVADRIADYSPDKTTKGQFVTNSTDITLPQDSNSITVWLRLTGKNTSGVGFDWIRLEDLGEK